MADKISKDSFVNAVRSIIKQRLINQSVTRSLKLCCGGDVLFNSENAVEEEIIKLLESEFDDQSGIIWEYITNSEQGIATKLDGTATTDETALYYALIKR
ncbi:MAG: hypothetical protein KBS41_03740 [Oscillospiraceae bacterium]|nr:hypothetical protein [Candidatus Equicaccousia limihippi]